jgi:hypothetical protein
VRSKLPQIAANGSLNYNPILQTTVIDGAGFGQPGTIQAAFGQMDSTAGVPLIKPCRPSCICRFEGSKINS